MKTNCNTIQAIDQHSSHIINNYTGHKKRNI
jgi:hypothetical protein